MSIWSRGSVLVTGATGTHGGAVARGLLSAGYPVSALVRDPNSERASQLSTLGIKLVAGDLDDPRSLVSAFRGPSALYAVTTPFGGGTGEEERQGQNIISAAEQAELPWLILASVAAADRAPVPHFASKARIEARVRVGTVPWTVIAPSYFYENVTGLAGSIAEGTLPLALPADKPLHQVALSDLGALVAAVMARRDEHLSARIEVAGDAPTPMAMASAIGARFVRLPLSEIRARSPDLAAMYEFLGGDGYGIDVAALRGRYPEVQWQPFAEWARLSGLRVAQTGEMRAADEAADG